MEQKYIDGEKVVVINHSRVPPHQFTATIRKAPDGQGFALQFSSAEENIDFVEGDNIQVVGKAIEH